MGAATKESVEVWEREIGRGGAEDGDCRIG